MTAMTSLRERHIEILRGLLAEARGGELLLETHEYEALDYAIAALSTPPAGEWVLVPREPTREMLRAAKRADMDHDSLDGWIECGTGHGLLRMWPAMLAAAPEPGHAGGGVMEIAASVISIVTIFLAGVLCGLRLAKRLDKSKETP